MKTVLITGASGFIGQNLCATLERDGNLSILKFNIENTEQELREYVERADFIFHLAGVNRPETEVEFIEGNTNLTQTIVRLLRESKKTTPLLITSSIQAELDNPYGRSKHAAEALVIDWAKETKADAYVYRLPNVFGKWCRPNYNSVVATFCYNIANGLPVAVNDPNHEMTLVYIDEVVADFTRAMEGKVQPHEDSFCYIPQTYKATLQEIKESLEAFNESRISLVMPNLESNFSKYLYATFTSYFATDGFSYPLKTNTDDRGWLAEFIKSKQFGQVFVSKTKPGISRGNHWHHTKIEKFLVVDGQADVCFRKVGDSSDKVLTYSVSGDKLTVLDIPVGYVHSIKNTGSTDLTTIFWADEILDTSRPDTYYEEV